MTAALTRVNVVYGQRQVLISPPPGSWYLEAGQGMGASINLAVQLDAYLLSDISTWLAFGNKSTTGCFMKIPATAF